MLYFIIIIGLIYVHYNYPFTFTKNLNAIKLKMAVSFQNLKCTYKVGIVNIKIL